MRAMLWNGINNLKEESVDDPRVLQPTDAIIEVYLSSICGSDVHLLNGFVPTMKKGDIIGHEWMGRVVEIGSEVTKLKVGDRVVVCSIIGCGCCDYCKKEQWSLCDVSNPEPEFQNKLYGQSTAGIFGYSHAFGGYAGSHAEYIRVPFADHGAFVVPDSITDEQAVFISDAAPTGFMAADMCSLKGGETVVVFGAGAVGLMAMKTARLLGAERIIAVDRIDYRLDAAKRFADAEPVNSTGEHIVDIIKELTQGKGPDACIDAVGMEANADGFMDLMDRAKQQLRIETDRPSVLRDCIRLCRKGGTVSVVGVYGGFIDTFPMGAAMNKALILRMGQQHGQHYIPKLIEYVESGALDTSFFLTKKMSLSQGMEGYNQFKHREDNVIRIVFDPRIRAETAA